MVKSIVQSHKQTRIIVYDDLTKKVQSMFEPEFVRLRQQNASKVFYGINNGQLDKNKVYLYAYSYILDGRKYGFILTKMYDVDQHDLNVFRNLLIKQYKFVKLYTIRGDLL